jgi:hypothetical protein
MSFVNVPQLVLEMVPQHALQWEASYHEGARNDAIACNLLVTRDSVKFK